MTRQTQREDDDALFAEANAWLFRLKADDASDADRAEFSSWLAHDERHEQAWRDVLQLMESLKEPARAYAARPHRAADRTAGSRGTRRFRATVGGLAAACLAAVIVVQGPAFLDRWGADYVTLSGERRAVVLADGTRVEMNSDTALDLDFESGERRVDVRRGEAFFTIAADPRAFVVIANGAEIRDIGTAFSVRNDNRAEVVVEDGLVDVSREDGKAPVRVAAGQKVAFGNGRISSAFEADPKTALAWRDGQIVFSQERLADVVAELNRYRAGRIFILNPRIADLRVSGTFEIDRPETVPQALRSVLGIGAREITPFLVLLH
ncbi:FecR family protein [Flaviflagellibacter deserti]|uniref:FecR family protein n=1 Tax=Flaviflagellibacter deserti TaxID=2267266 RepID=A0ABV9YYE4_9HYPH